MLIQRKTSAFTLVELLITVAVLAVLTVLALPSFRELLINQRNRAQAESFMSVMAYARSESITRNSRITLCRSNNGVSCGGTWSNGWIMFTDSGTIGALDGSDTVLRAHQFPAGSGITVTMSANFSNFISFLSTGISAGSGGGAGSITLCGTTRAARIIEVSTTGRPQKSLTTC